MSNGPLFFSIVVPACNRPERLGSCLDSLSCSEYPRDGFEVVVVEDGSTESLLPVVEKFKEKLDIIFLSQPNCGPAAARNRGAENAKGKYLVFLDDDCILPPHFLPTIERRLSRQGDCALAGMMTNVFTGNPFSSSTQVLIDYLHSYYNSKNGMARFLTSNSLVVPADEFREIGGFDTDFTLAAGEDRDLCERWHLHGKKVLLSPELKVLHVHWLRFRDFLRQHFNYGRGAWLFHRKRALRDRKPLWQSFEGASFYCKLFLYPLSRPSLKHKPLIFALLLFSQAATCTGFFWEKFKGSGNSLPPSTDRTELGAPPKVPGVHSEYDIL